MQQSISKRYMMIVSLFTIGLLVAACSEDKPQALNDTTNLSQQNIELKVFKSPGCSCCAEWTEHMNSNGFEAKEYVTEQMHAIKNNQNIANQYRSCHTAISVDGYIFEGHVPAKHVKQFLAEKPKDALGLSVPAMPVGSPGMEVDDKFMPYQVLLLKKDGTSEVYASIKKPSEQY